MKKFLMSFAAMLVIVACAFAQSGAPSLKGDVNEDGTVNVADINAIIAIMKNVQEHYFYLGTIQPTAENYKIIPGMTNSFTSLDEVNGTTVSVDAGQTLYMMCPAEWMTGKKVVIEDKSGETFRFSEDVDNTTVLGYAIYKTQVWEVSSEATIKTSPDVEPPIVELLFEAYWDYEISYGGGSAWYYGWDETDRAIFGELSYSVPTSFQLRRYYTGNTPMGTPLKSLATYLNGSTFRDIFDFGYWDILAWSEVQTFDGIQNLAFDESLESVTAYTNKNYYQSSYYQPEQLFSAFERGIEINQNLTGFVYDTERNMWTKKLYMILEPVTYIYPVQVILHNNRNRIIGVSGSATLSGMARSTNLNTGVSGTDAVAVGFNVRMKKNMDIYGETVDIVGGRLMTFGICGQNGNRVRSASDVNDTEQHYLDMEVQYSNGNTGNLTFDVTDQVRRCYKGGVITVEFDMDTMPMN